MNDSKLDFIYRIRTRLFIRSILVALFLLGFLHDVFIAR